MSDQDNSCHNEESKARHIRPKLRRKLPQSSSDNNRNGKEQLSEQAIEATRQRMESWMGLRENKSKKIASSDSTKSNFPKDSTAVASPTLQNNIQRQQPVSILKKPKYTIVPSTNASSVHNNIEQSGHIHGISDTILAATNDVEANDDIDDTDIEDSSTDQTVKKEPVICKDIIVERDPTRPLPKRKPFRKPAVNGNDRNNVSSVDTTVFGNNSTIAKEYASIEGYIPASTPSQIEPISSTSAAVAAGNGVRKQRNHSSSSEGTQLSSIMGHNDEADQDKEDDTKDPLTLNTLADLMEASGQKLPENPHRITDDTKVVEANIEFSVMTQEQYEKNLSSLKEEREVERQEQLKVFVGRQDIFGEDDEDEDERMATDDESPIQDGLDDNNDDDLMEFLLGSGLNANADDEDGNDDEPRAFRLLWQALTDWMTPETVTWVKRLHSIEENHDGTSSIVDSEWVSMVDRSDIGASRCAGVMAMLRLYLAGCLEELKRPTEERRRAEKRLTDILRTFDYSRDNPKLHVSQWKAMTCILLDMVLIERRDGICIDQVPPSVAAVGMTLDEYQYLSRKTVVTFDMSSNAY